MTVLFGCSNEALATGSKCTSPGSSSNTDDGTNDWDLQIEDRTAPVGSEIEGYESEVFELHGSERGSC